jgi:putative DNA primase/helicase
MKDTESIPEELRKLNQWVCYKTKDRPDGKTEKLPVNAITGKLASHSAPDTWASFDQAINRYRANKKDLAGVGFVFAKGIVGIDLDDVRDSHTGAIADGAWTVLERFKHCYTEHSPSGKGFHIICKGKLPQGGRKNGWLEVYDTQRFFTVTGNAFRAKPVAPAQDQVDWLLKNHFKPTEPKPDPEATHREPLGLSDLELVEKARKAKTGLEFTRLYDGDHSAYPSPSEADQALCNMLAFWARNDADHIDRLFRQSGLLREKWDKKHHSDGSTYGQMTIAKAIASTTETYDPSKRQNEQPNHENATQNSQKEPPNSKKEASAEVSSISAADLLNHKFDHIPPIIGQGIMPQQTAMIIAGESGVGKSLITLEIAVRLAMGWQIFDLDVPTARTIKIFQAENPLDQVQFRLRRIIQGLRISRLPDTIHFSNPKTRYDLSNARTIKTMISEIQACSADVFIIDPLISFHAVNENDNVMIRSRVLDNVTLMCRETGAAAIVVDHFNKPTQDNRNVAYRLRGGIAKKDWCDTLLCISKRRHEHKILNRIDFVKIRNGPGKPSLLVERTNSFLNVIVEEDMLVSVHKVKEILEIDLGGKAERQTDLVQAIVEKCGCNERTVKRAIRRTVDMGYIRELSGAGKTKIYVSMDTKS